MMCGVLSQSAVMMLMVLPPEPVSTVSAGLDTPYCARMILAERRVAESWDKDGMAVIARQQSEQQAAALQANEPRRRLELIPLSRDDALAVEEHRAPPHLVAFDRGWMLGGTAGQIERAIKLFREATVLKPDFAEAHYNIGYLLTEIEQFPEAIAPFRKAAALKPDNADIHNNLGFALAKNKQFREAITAFRKARKVEPDINKRRAITLRIKDYVEKENEVEFDESNRPDYNNDTMDEAAKACLPAADYFGLPVEVVTETLAKLRAKAARETTARAAAKPRLKWNKDNRPDEDPAHFAWRAYQAEAEAGTLHRGLIGQEDKLLRRDLNNWLRTHPMPEGIDIPTKPEWNTRQLGKLGIEAGEPPETARLYEVAKKRRQRSAQPAPTQG